MARIGTNTSDDLMIVPIRREGRKTNVSLDVLLFEWLAHRYGGVVGAQAWIRRAVHRIEVLLEANDPLVTAGRIGFSRLIQRMIVKELIEAAGGIGRELGDGHLRGQAALVEALKEMDANDGAGGGEVERTGADGIEGVRA